MGVRWCLGFLGRRIALSTTEAEYVAMVEGVKEALQVRGILTFQMPGLGSTGIGVLEDNKRAKYLAQNPVDYYMNNNKHIDVRYHFLRELVTSGDIS